MDVSNDFLKFDGLETVTVSGSRTSGSFSFSTAYALRRAVDVRRDVIAGGVGLGSNSIVWNISIKDFGSNTLEEGDKITDGASKVWEVNTCQILTMGSRWRAVCTEVRS